MAKTTGVGRKRSSAAHLPLGERGDGRFYGQHILSVSQFARTDLEYIFAVAEEMHTMVERVGTFDLLKGKILASLFYEPSTRTSSSFTAAMERLGGSVISINEVKYSSVAKGESLPDTIRTLECYSDVIVLRHPETGAAATAARYARKPIINAGDGTGEHPTALRIQDDSRGTRPAGRLTVTMLGFEVRRTAHSLSRLLALYGAKLNYVSPDICGCRNLLWKNWASSAWSRKSTRILSRCWPKPTCCM
jgi:aspartate carbamoyltransferase catalytic subunit